jgi:hypothetical protein
LRLEFAGCNIQMAGWFNNRLAMKVLLATSLVCSVTSLLGLVALSAMSVVPGAETWRWGMMLAVAVFMISWLGLAVWTRRRLKASTTAATLPAWLGRTIVIAGAVYVLLVLLFSFG